MKVYKASWMCREQEGMSDFMEFEFEDDFERCLDYIFEYLNRRHMDVSWPSLIIERIQ